MRSAQDWQTTSSTSVNTKPHQESTYVILRHQSSFILAIMASTPCTSVSTSSPACMSTIPTSAQIIANTKLLAVRQLHAAGALLSQIPILSKLPLEVKLAIWKLVDEPRIIGIQFGEDARTRRWRYVADVPVWLQINHNIRELALNYWAYFMVDSHSVNNVFFNYESDIFYYKSRCCTLEQEECFFTCCIKSASLKRLRRLLIEQNELPYIRNKILDSARSFEALREIIFHTPFPGGSKSCGRSGAHLHDLEDTPLLNSDNKEVLSAIVRLEKLALAETKHLITCTTCYSQPQLSVNGKILYTSDGEASHTCQLLAKQGISVVPKWMCGSSGEIEWLDPKYLLPDLFKPQPTPPSRQSSRCADLKHAKVHSVPQNPHLRPATTPAEREYSTPTPRILDGEEVWFVEKILSTRIRNQQRQYLVHWKDTSPAIDSWEPAENLQELDTLKDFLSTHSKATQAIKGAKARKNKA